MKIVNHSILVDSTIKKLVNFVTQYTKFHHLCVIRVENSKIKGYTGYGYAWKKNETCWWKYNEPSLVEVYLYKDILPYTQNGLRVINREDEFVLILAHELKHIDDFWSHIENDWEQRAEKFAQKIYKIYKGESKCFRKKR